AHNCATPEAKQNIAASTAIRVTVDRTLILKSANSPDDKTFFFRDIAKTKMPRELRGATSATPSREELRKPRHGRVAWLTALQPITVAGARPGFTPPPPPPSRQH